MSFPESSAEDAFARLDTAEVIFVAKDGHRLAPSRVRCYSFAKLLNQRGIRAEVLSFHDHLGASDLSDDTLAHADDEKLRLNALAFQALSRNPRALLYVQKAHYHALAVALAATCNGNPFVLDYDDFDVHALSFHYLESWFPSLTSAELLATIARRAQACVVSSHKILDLVAPFNTNTHLIHTVADLDLFHAGNRAAPRRRFGDAVNILWCGDVWGDLPMRDILFGVDAFALMPADIRRRARFHIFGFGNAWEELKRRLRLRHPDLGEVVLHERIDPAEFGSVLSEMDIGVLPYANNAFNVGKSPTKMFEFLLANVAVLATPVGEVTYCLENERSVVLADGLEGFSAALARLIQDDDWRRRIAAEGHRTGMERYTLNGIGDRLVDIVRAAMRTGSEGGEEVAGEERTLEGFMARALGRQRAISRREVQIAQEDLALLMRQEDPAAIEARRWSAPLLALLDWPGLATTSGMEADRVQPLKVMGQRLRIATRLRPTLDLPTTERPEGVPQLCKLAASEDWEDDVWWSWVDRFKVHYASFPLNADGRRRNTDDSHDLVYNYYKRSRGAWERVQLLYGLDALGLLSDTGRLLVASTHEDGFYLFLSNHARHVDVVDLDPRASEHAVRVAQGDFDPWLLKPRLFRGDRLTIHHVGSGGAPDVAGRWDAVVGLGVAGFQTPLADFLAWADTRLSIGGVVAFSSEVLLDGGAGMPGIPVRWLGEDGFATQLARITGMETIGPFDASLSDATLDRFVDHSSAGASNPHFVARTGNVLHMPAVWFCRKRAETPLQNWNRLATALT